MGEALEKGNTFTFFGEIFNGSGTKTGYGNIVTFGGGGASSEKWHASEATTLEDILSHTAVPNIKATGQLKMLVPNSPRLGNMFNFKKNVQLPRFSIYIQDSTKDKEGKVIKVERMGTINFIEVKVVSIARVPNDKLFMDMVSCTVTRQSVSAVTLSPPK